MKHFPTIDCPARQGGFTLIELLVVITLIALLGSMSIAVSRVAIESAKKSRTEMTIAKIDSALTAMYEKYADKKVDISPYLTREFSNTNANAWYYNYYKEFNYTLNDLWNYYGSNTTAKFYATTPSNWNGVHGPTYLRNNHFLIPALWRLHLIRDTIRMDMPCWATEVYWGPVLPDGTLDRNEGRVTPLHAIYRGALTTATNNNWDAIFSWNDAQHAQFNAELLFLVIMNGDPESRQLFSDREVADVNNNGLFEFIDGWGRPIYWLRWAPGIGSTDRPFFEAILWNDSGVSPQDRDDLRAALTVTAINTDSDRQYAGNEVYTGVYACIAANRGTTNPVFDYINGVTDIEAALEHVGPIRDDDDPLDPLGIDCLCPILDNNRLTSKSWLLVPYVFSCGADGMPGINSGNFRCNNVGQMPEFMRTTLYPFQYNLNCGKYETDTNGFLTNYQKDNIHNHKITR